MSMVKNGKTHAFSPRYFLINRSEPQYDLIKGRLLDNSSLPAGASHYFVRTDNDMHCLCRIRAGNGTVLFYEILDHIREGISDQDLMEAAGDPKNASPLPEYCHLSHKIEEHLRQYLAVHAQAQGSRCLHRTAA